jgi:3-mercaptopyruvate sulfurtransferase SseA
MGLEEKELRDLMKKAGITEDEVIVTFHAKGKFKDAMSFVDIDDWGFIKKSVIGNWNAFKNAVEKYGKEDPFINHEA